LELYEISLVDIPDNPLTVMKALELYKERHDNDTESNTEITAYDESIQPTEDCECDKDEVEIIESGKDTESTEEISGDTEVVAESDKEVEEKSASGEEASEEGSQEEMVDEKSPDCIQEGESKEECAEKKSCESCANCANCPNKETSSDTSITDITEEIPQQDIQKSHVVKDTKDVEVDKESIGNTSDSTDKDTLPENGDAEISTEEKSLKSEETKALESYQKRLDDQEESILVLNEMLTESHNRTKALEEVIVRIVSKMNEVVTNAPLQYEAPYKEAPRAKRKIEKDIERIQKGLKI